MKPYRRINALARHLGLLSTTSALVLMTGPVGANPVSEQVVAGSAGFDRSVVNSLLVSQTSQNAVIDWRSFSIGASEATKFVVPTGGATLNRVTSGDPSSIYGSLSSNGVLMLLNPNGILVGPSGTIDTAGLVLSTLDVSNAEFMARGDLTFRGNSTASVINFGRITTFDGGDVYMFAREVENHGSISAPGGTVGLAAGSEILLSAADSTDGRVSIRAGVGKVVNSGTIAATVAELRAAGGNQYALAVNNTGVVRATGVSTRGGRVFLTANSGKIASSGTISARNADGSGGKVRFTTRRVAASDASPKTVAAVDISGTVDVSGTAGGTVVVEAESIRLAKGASIDASGATGGGQISIGGGFRGKDASIVDATDVTVEAGVSIKADSTESGDAGKVVVWADGTTSFAGVISAQALGASGDGGSVEVSGKQSLAFLDEGSVATLSKYGAAGSLLLDPEAATIADDAADAEPLTISSAKLVELLTSGNVEVTGAAGITIGNVTSGAHVVWVNGAGQVGTTLTLSGPTITVDASGGDVVIQNLQESRSAAYLATHQTTVDDFIQEHDAIVFDAPAISIGNAVTQLHRIAIGAEYGNTVIGDGLGIVSVQSGSVDGASTQIGLDLATVASVRGSAVRGDDYQLYHATDDKTDPRYYSQVWVEHAHNGDIEITGTAVSVTSGGEPLDAENYSSGNFVQIGHGGNANAGYWTKNDGTYQADGTSGAAHHDLLDTSGYAVLDAKIEIDAALALALATGGSIPGMSGERAYVQIGHGVDNWATDQQIVQGDLSGDIVISAASMSVGAAATFSAPIAPVERLGEQVESIRVGSGGHATYKGVALPAAADGSDRPEIVTGRISGNIGVTVGGLTVGGLETIETVGPASNTPIQNIVRHDQIGHGATVKVIVSDDGSAPSYGAIQTEIGAIGNFLTINGSYRNVIDFNNPYYQLTKSSADADSTDLSNAANAAPIVYYTVDYKLNADGTVTRTITAHDRLPDDEKLYDGAKLNTGLITYYDGTATLTNGDKTVKLNGLLRSFVGTLINSDSGSTGASTYTFDGSGTKVLTAGVDYLTDKNGNPIILLPIDNAYGVTGVDADGNVARALADGVDVAANPALIVKGTDWATNYTAYMPVTSATSADTHYGSTAGNVVSVTAGASDTAGNISGGTISNTVVATGETQIGDTVTKNADDTTGTKTGAKVDATGDDNYKTLYGVQMMNTDGTVTAVTAYSLTAPRNAVAGASDAAQRFVANADGYNDRAVYADGLLTPRYNTHAAGSPDITISAGITTVADGVIAAFQTGNIVNQWQYALIGNGNWVRSKADTTVAATAYTYRLAAPDDDPAVVETVGGVDVVRVAATEKPSEDRNTSSRGDLVVDEGYVTGNIHATTALLTVSSTVNTGAQAEVGNVDIYARIGNGSVFDLISATGADAASGLHAARGADVTVNSADILGSNIDIEALGVIVLAQAGQGGQALTTSNLVSASIGNGADIRITTGDGGAGGVDAAFAGVTDDTGSTASARAGDATVNRGSIGDGLLLVDDQVTDNLGGAGKVGGVVVGGVLKNAGTGTWSSWNADGDVYYTGNYGDSDPATAGKVEARRGGALASTTGATPTIWGSEIRIVSPLAVSVTAASIQGAQGAVVSNESLARIGHGNRVQIATGDGGSASDAASGGRGGDVTLTQRQSLRDLDGDFHIVHNGGYALASNAAWSLSPTALAYEDVASGERGDVHVSASAVSVLANVTTGLQGTASFNSDRATVGTGDDMTLTTGVGGAAGSGNVSGVDSLHAAHGGAGGNVNVLLANAETQGDILIDGYGSTATSSERGGALAVNAAIVEGQQTLSNFNQAEAVLGHTTRIAAVAGKGGAGSTGSFSADVRGGDGGTIYVELPKVDDRLDTAAQYATLGLTFDDHYSHLGTSDVTAVVGSAGVGATRTSTSNTTSPAEGVSDNIYGGIGARNRVVAVAGAGGKGGSAPAGFGYGLQADASGGNGGDAVSVSGSVRGGIRIDATGGSVLVTNSLAGSPVGGDGGLTQVIAQIGDDQDIYTSAGLAGDGGALLISGTIGSISLSGDKGGILNAQTSGQEALDGTTKADLTIKIIPTKADGSLNRGGTDNGIDISGTGADGGTIKAKGAAWSVEDLASVGTAAPVTTGAVVANQVTLAGDKFVLYDKAGNPQYKFDATHSVWVDNTAPSGLDAAAAEAAGYFVAGSDLSNVLGADINRDGRIDVITFRGVEVADGTTSVVGTTTTISGTGSSSSARVDVVDVNGDGLYDQLAGRTAPFGSSTTNVAYVGGTNSAVRNGVLDYETVASRTVVTPIALGTNRSGDWSGSTAVVVAATNAGNTNAGNVGFGSGIDGGYSLQVATVAGSSNVSGDFSRSNGGRGGDAVIATGYTLGAIDVLAESLSVITNIDDIISGSPSTGSGQVGLPNDRYTARVGHGGTYLADTADTAQLTSWQAGKTFGPTIPPMSADDLKDTGKFVSLIEDLASALPLVTTRADGGDGGLDAVIAVGGRAGDSLIVLGSDRPVTAAGLAGATEWDELTGAITISAKAVTVMSSMNNDLGGNLGIAQIGHGDQIFANANGSQTTPLAVTSASTQITPWRAGLSDAAVLLGLGSSGDVGGDGKADATNLVTEIASGGRGGNATIAQGNLKGVVTIRDAAAVNVEALRGQLSVWTTNAYTTPSFDDTVVAQIGHGSYGVALAGNGGKGGDARMEASGGAGGNASVAFGSVIDSGIYVIADGIGITSSVWEYQNQIGRAQIGSGNLGFATAGFGGKGAPVSTADLHGNGYGYHLAENVVGSIDRTTLKTRAVEGIAKATAGVYLDETTGLPGEGSVGGTFVGGKGGSATVSTGLVDGGIGLTLTNGGNLTVFSDIGQQMITQGYVSLDDHVLATVGHGSYAVAVSGAGGAGGVGQAGEPVAIDGGAGGDATVSFGTVGLSAIAGRSYGADGSAADANGNAYVDRLLVDIASAVKPTAKPTTGAPIDILFEDGGKLLVLALSGQQAATLADPLDNAVRSNAAIVGHTAFGYADSSWAVGGDAGQAADVAHADGGAGGSASVLAGDVLGSISVGRMVGGVVTEAPDGVLVIASETEALDVGRIEAHIGHYRQVEARAGLDDGATLRQANGGMGGHAKDYAISEYDNFDYATHTWYGVGAGAQADASNVGTVQYGQPLWYPINQRGSAAGGAGGDASVVLGTTAGDVTVLATGSNLVQPGDEVAAEAAAAGVALAAETALVDMAASIPSNTTLALMQVTNKALNEALGLAVPGGVNVLAVETMPSITPVPGTNTVPAEVIADAGIGFSDRTKAVAADGGIGGTVDSAPNGWYDLTAGTSALPIALADDASAKAIEKSIDALASAGGKGGDATVASGAQLGNVRVGAPTVWVQAVETSGAAIVAPAPVAATNNGLSQTASIGHSEYNLLTLAGDGGLDAERGGDGGRASLTQGGFGGDVSVTADDALWVSAISNQGVPSARTSAYVGDREIVGTDLAIANGTGSPALWIGGIYGGDAGTGGNGGAVSVDQKGTVATRIVDGSTTIVDASSNDVTLRSFGTLTVDAATLGAGPTGLDAATVTTHVGHDVRLVQAVAGAGSASGLPDQAAYVREDGSEALAAKGGDLAISQGPIDADITVRATDDVTVQSSAAFGLTATAIVGSYTTVESATSGAGAAVVTSFADSAATGTDGSYAGSAAGSGDGGKATVTQGAIAGNILIQSDSGNTTVQSTAALGTAETLIGAQRMLTVLSGAGGSLGGEGGDITIGRGDVTGDITIASFVGKTTAVTANGAVGAAATKVGHREYEKATAGDGNGGAAVDLADRLGKTLTDFAGATVDDVDAGGSLDDARAAIRAMESAIAAMRQSLAKAQATGTGDAATIRTQIDRAVTALNAATSAKDAPAVANSNALPHDDNDPAWVNGATEVKKTAVSDAIRTIQTSASTVADAVGKVAALSEKLVDPGQGGSIAYTGNGLVSGKVGIYATASTAVSGLKDPNTVDADHPDGLDVALDPVTKAPTKSGTVNISSNALGAATTVQVGSERSAINASGNGGGTVGTPGAISITDTTSVGVAAVGGTVSVSALPLGTVRVGDVQSVENTAGTADVGDAIETGGKVTSTSTIGTASDILVYAQVGDASIGSSALGATQIGHSSVETQTGGAQSAVEDRQTIDNAITVASKGATTITGNGSTRVGDTINATGNLLSTARGTTPAGQGSERTQTIDAPITLAVATNLVVDGTIGKAEIGNSSPATIIASPTSVNGQLTTLTPVIAASVDNVAMKSGWNGASAQVQTIGGDITIDVNVPDAAKSPALLSDLMAGVTKGVGTGSTTAGVGDTTIKGAGARVGHSYDATDNTLQSVSGDILVKTGADLLVQDAAIGHDHYDEDATRSRISGSTTIGAGQNTPGYEENTSADLMKFTNAVVTSGFKENDGKLRFFIPSRSNLTTDTATQFNDSATTSDGVKKRSDDKTPIFAGNGGSPHENGFMQMPSGSASSAPYGLVGDANFAFYFATPQPILYDPWAPRVLHAGLGGNACDASVEGMGQVGAFDIGYGSGGGSVGGPAGILAASSSNWAIGGGALSGGHCAGGGGSGGGSAGPGPSAGHGSGGGTRPSAPEQRADVIVGQPSVVANFVEPTRVVVRQEDIVIAPAPVVPSITRASVIAGVSTAVQIRPARLNVLSMAASGVAPTNYGGLQ